MNWKKQILLFDFVRDILAEEANGLGKRCQDDDSLLCSIVYTRLGYGAKPLSELGALVKADKIPCPRVIYRNRERVQDKYPELRGTKWDGAKLVAMRRKLTLDHKHQSQPILTSPVPPILLVTDATHVHVPSIIADNLNQPASV